jgi:lysozyme
MATTLNDIIRKVEVSYQDKLDKLLKEHEGYRGHAYKDTKGVDTIWYGHNLNHGIEYRSVANVVFELDKLHHTIECYELFGEAFRECNQIRKGVLVNMMFNMGRERLSKFKKMIAALEKKDYEEASKEMKDSKWYRQDVPTWRSIHLIQLMKHGTWVEYQPF